MTSPYGENSRRNLAASLTIDCACSRVSRWLVVSTITDTVNCGCEGGCAASVAGWAPPLLAVAGTAPVAIGAGALANSESGVCVAEAADDPQAIIDRISMETESRP